MKVTEKKVTKKAYAKINLTLEILGTRRGDGYHDIASVMHKAPCLYDDVVVLVSQKLCGITLSCDKDVCAPSDNLAYRAAKAYIDLCAEKNVSVPGVNIDIRKNIPAGAGLAGGSSDAAAVLDALNKALGVLSDEEIFKIAFSLGSDVPFCLEKHTCALCTGRGEIIKELSPLKNTEIKILVPDSPLYTKAVYSEYDRLYGDDYTKSKSLEMAKALEKGEDTQSLAKYMCNDFEEICVRQCPEIAVLCEKLKGEGYFSQMSGSGCAVFGIRSTGNN